MADTNKRERQRSRPDPSERSVEAQGRLVDGRRDGSWGEWWMLRASAIPLTAPSNEVKIIGMTFSAGQDAGLGPFLLIWSLLALVIGGGLATKKWSSRYRNFIVTMLASQQPLSPRQAERVRRAKRMPAGFVRFIGGIFAVAGAVALPVSVTMLMRH
ncbi:hypothetical protein ACWGQ5_43855 [Streptomyces sp. NPDC055722]